jgi:hypothetical protein
VIAHEQQSGAAGTRPMPSGQHPCSAVATAGIAAHKQGTSTVATTASATIAVLEAFLTASIGAPTPQSCQ